jgi:hypothetical protein
VIWKKIAYRLYPLLVGILLPLILFLTIYKVQAGTIRKIELSQDKSATVRLAPGRTTAVSFAIKPEKVVPGNPQSLEINFLGRDLTLRPIGPHPGNLIIYTKSGRYVILLHLVSQNEYDDVVTVNTSSPYKRPIRLLEDSFSIQNFKAIFVGEKREHLFSASVKHGGHILETQELPAKLRCRGCIVRKKEDVVAISCATEVRELDCRYSNKIIKIEGIR